MKTTNKAHRQKNSFGNLSEIKFCIKYWNVKCTNTNFIQVWRVDGKFVK